MAEAIAEYVPIYRRSTAEQLEAAKHDVRIREIIIDELREKVRRRLAAGYDPTRCMGEVDDYRSDQRRQCLKSPEGYAEELGYIVGFCHGHHGVNLCVQLQREQDEVARLERRLAAEQRQAARPPFSGGVYAVLDADRSRVKIGYATDLKHRMSGLRNGNPTKLTVARWIPTADENEARQLEAELHRRFAHLRVRGEWFKLTPKTRAWLAEGARDQQEALA